ncbi:MAG: hypothetical protein NZZ41_06355, partial [Candidatus Dojkabacteria bacterium]|nr:hypothetical protein [Candidatus Dojkabacteria bacterium]
LTVSIYRFLIIFLFSILIIFWQTKRIDSPNILGDISVSSINDVKCYLDSPKKIIFLEIDCISNKLLYKNPIIFGLLGVREYLVEYVLYDDKSNLVVSNTTYIEDDYYNVYINYPITISSGQVFIYVKNIQNFTIIDSLSFEI